MAETLTISPMPSPLVTATVPIDVVTEGQHKINLVWEATQAVIAIAITLAVITCAITGKTSQELTNSFFLIVGFYFSRTNHTQVAGIGLKPVSNQ